MSFNSTNDIEVLKYTFDLQGFIVINNVLSEKEINEIQLLMKLIKQRKDSLALYMEQNRDDLAKIEKEEIEIIEEFLPKQLSEDDLDKEITAIIEELGASEIKDMGRVMGVASKKLSGKADNGRIAKLIKEKLN